MLKKYWWLVAIAAGLIYYFGFHKKGKGFGQKPTTEDVVVNSGSQPAEEAVMADPLNDPVR